MGGRPCLLQFRQHAEFVRREYVQIAQLAISEIFVSLPETLHPGCSHVVGEQTDIAIKSENLIIDASQKQPAVVTSNHTLLKGYTMLHRAFTIGGHRVHQTTDLNRSGICQRLAPQMFISVL